MKRYPLYISLFCILLSLSFSLSSYSQPYDPTKVNRNAVALYNKAMERLDDDNYASAAGLLLQCIDIDKRYVEAYLSLAGIYGQLKNYKSSVDYYEKAFAIDSDFTLPYKLSYSINLAGLGEFDKALAAINDLLTKRPPLNSTSLKAAQYRQRCYQFAIDYAKKNSDNAYLFSPKNIGSGINTSESEYFPCLTIDGKELVFTRRIKNVNEDFYYSKRKGDSWDTAKPMEGNVNTELNEGAQNISQDGQWLVFTGCDRPGGFGGCDLYISYLTDKGWSEAVNLGGTVNSDQWDSQPCLSPDKRDLYFCSRRLGGYGGSDLYVCHLQGNGKWGEPENLGPSINTAGNEASPFIHADNQTLYFTSDGLPGYGNNDIYFVKKGPGGDWSQPVNLGYPINTIEDEGTLFIAANGRTAYYSSNRGDSRGGLDIYSFELRENIRPYQTGWVKGRVFDKKTSAGLPSSVELIDLATHQLISKVQTDEKGNYLITLPVGKDYAFNVNRKGYLFFSDNFPMTHSSPDSVYEKDIPLQAIEANATIVLKNIFFDVNKFDLKPESQVELDKLVQLMNENPGLKVEIGGHTDNVGKPTDNLTLSNNRAKAVVSYLASKNINTNRLAAKGYGETKPIADNKTEEGKAMNRRTEVKVVNL